MNNNKGRKKEKIIVIQKFKRQQKYNRAIRQKIKDNTG